MNNSIDLSDSEPVNHLWSDLLNLYGVERAKQAVRQAIDLQGMHGSKNTLPVLFVKTGGVALTSFQLLKLHTGISIYGSDKVVLYCPKDKLIQVLHEFREK